jgi:hypothetical protein
VLQVRDQHAGRAEYRRLARDQHERNLELARDRSGVDRARAARNDEDELARIVAALHRHDTECGRHVRVDDLVDTVGRTRDVEPERLRDVFLDRSLRSRTVELELTAVESLRVEVAKHEVGVGDGRQRAAATVARRTRLRARARGGPPRATPGLDPRDRAAARTDPWISRIGDAIRWSPIEPSVVMPPAFAHERDIERCRPCRW